MRADLALVGFGHVGQRFASLLGECGDRLRRLYDLECRIVGIATRRHGTLFSPSGIETSQAIATVAQGRPFASRGAHRGPASPALDVIQRLAGSTAPIRIVIETTTLAIRDGQPAIAHVEAALDAGCHVVTANKGPVAFAWRSLQTRADAAGLSFLFEGVVMDGVPIFNLVRETMPAIVFHGFRGVVNSTTNHILTALEEGEAFAPALADMQARGIAEADATLDIEGWDAAAKAAALANVLMGADITPHDVDRCGIGPGTAARARAVRSAGRRLRLVAAARRSGGRVVATVQPTELAADDLLASLRGPANALVFETDLLGEVAVHQLGGDLTMTAYALLSDVITIRRRTR